MVNIKDNLVKTLADNPELYKIVNSKDHISILKEIFKENLDFSNIKRKTYIKKDNIIYNILETLEQKELIKKIEVNNNIQYYITENGKKLINLYEEAKKEYNI